MHDKKSLFVNQCSFNVFGHDFMFYYFSLSKMLNFVLFSCLVTYKSNLWKLLSLFNVCLNTVLLFFQMIITFLWKWKWQRGKFLMIWWMLQLKNRYNRNIIKNFTKHWSPSIFNVLFTPPALHGVSLGWFHVCPLTP